MEVYIFHLLVDHTHDNIDAPFGRWNMYLCDDYPTMQVLMKFYIVKEKIATTLHIIEKLPIGKAFIDFFCQVGMTFCLDILKPNNSNSLFGMIVGQQCSIN